MGYKKKKIGRVTDLIAVREQVVLLSYNSKFLLFFLHRHFLCMHSMMKGFTTLCFLISIKTSCLYLIRVNIVSRSKEENLGIKKKKGDTHEL